METDVETLLPPPRQQVHLKALDKEPRLGRPRLADRQASGRPSRLAGGTGASLPRLARRGTKGVRMRSMHAMSAMSAMSAFKHGRAVAHPVSRGSWLQEGAKMGPQLRRHGRHQSLNDTNFLLVKPIEFLS